MIVIDAPHFYCGVVLRNGVVTRTAPIVSYMKGWSKTKVLSYCNKKQWKVVIL